MSEHDERIKIERAELFDPEVDKALARDHAQRERIVADAPPVSPVRRFLMNPLVYLPVAALLGALLAFRLLDPQIQDFPVVGGEVQLINAEPFDGAPGVIAMTIGNHEVYVDTGRVQLDPGADGEPAFANVDAIKVGDKIEVVGDAEGGHLVAGAIRPTARSGSFGATDKAWWPLVLFFPLTAAFISLGLLLAEGFTTRNWLRMIERSIIGGFLSALFSLIAMIIPGGIVLLIGQHVLQSEIAHRTDAAMFTMQNVGGFTFCVFAACRAAAWAGVGAAAGLGMNLVRSTKAQLRNSIIGGALGGAFGGVFFDPIDRWVRTSLYTTSSTSRLVGLIAVGLSIGIFVALVERLGREAWLRVRTGPLAGKSFILYKTPTVIGSSPSSDVYLFKDAEIDAAHATIHRVGVVYEIEDMASRMGTQVGGSRIRRRRLASGDQIILGSTILDFEERQKRTQQV
ncbi:MAG TPA: FHA domain-containing protein [Kofleriaceae bacterium]|nr:FHA domain-containing protein [Kofleriaceae bacterium]